MASIFHGPFSSVARSACLLRSASLAPRLPAAKSASASNPVVCNVSLTSIRTAGRRGSGLVRSQYTSAVSAPQFPRVTAAGILERGSEKESE